MQPNTTYLQRSLRPASRPEQGTYVAASDLLLEGITDLGLSRNLIIVILLLLISLIVG